MADKGNWIDLHLTPEQEKEVQEVAALYRAHHVETIDTIFRTARVIEMLRNANYGAGVQGSFAGALVQYGFTNHDGGPMDPAIRSNYKALLDNEAAARAWWNSIEPPRKKRDWLSARAIYRHWQASLKPKTPKAPKAPRTPPPQAEQWVPDGIGAKPSADAMVAKQAANAEAEAAAMADKHEISDLKARIADLEGELAKARTSARSGGEPEAAPSEPKTLLTVLNDACDAVLAAHEPTNWPVAAIADDEQEHIASLALRARLDLIELVEIYERLAEAAKTDRPKTAEAKRKAAAADDPAAPETPPAGTRRQRSKNFANYIKFQKTLAHLCFCCDPLRSGSSRACRTPYNGGLQH